MRKRVVLQDIANELNVSKNTVSRALRDCIDISEETKVKIKNKANEMGYVPNALSIFFRENLSRLVGIVTSDLNNPYYSIHIDKLINKLSEYGFAPITILTNSGYLDFKILKHLLNYQVCAIISFQDYSNETYEFLKDKNIPILLYGLLSKYQNTKAVYTDDFEGGRLIAKEFLSSKKYQNPCMIAWQEDVETFHRRRDGFITELKENNIIAPIYIVGYGDKEKYTPIIENNHDFVFAYCDALGVDLKDYLKEKNYKCKVYGFDGINYHNTHYKKVSSISCDAELMAAYTAIQIKKYICNPNYEIQSKMFPVKLRK